MKAKNGILVLLCVVIFSVGCDDTVSAGETCGDGVKDPGEECDMTAFGGETCISQGFLAGSLMCNDMCRIVTTNCEGKCGDGAIFSGLEDCDGDNLGLETCETLGYYGGNIHCTNECTYDLSECLVQGRCGDGVTQSQQGEECDTNDLGGITCVDLGYDAGTLGCTENCRYDVHNCYGTVECPNGVREGDEECDGGDQG